MITLEGYEIEEMRSINHIMTVELQFDKPVTQKEARDYLSRVLAKANELEMQAEKEKDFRELAEKNALEAAAQRIGRLKEIAANKFGVPLSIIEKPTEEEKIIAIPQDEEMREYLSKADERLNELSFAFPQEKPAAAVKKSEGVLKVPVTEEEIADMKQKKLEEEAKAEKPKKIDWDKACALKKAGWSNKQIAEELHANEGTIGAMIYKHLEKYNAGERKVKYEEKAEV